MENNQSTQPPPSPSVSKIEHFLKSSFPNFRKFFIIGLVVISSGKYIKLYFRSILFKTIIFNFLPRISSSECTFWQKCPSQSSNLEGRELFLKYSWIFYPTHDLGWFSIVIFVLFLSIIQKLQFGILKIALNTR